MKLVKPIDLFQNAMKILPERRRLLGLDVGNKYIGLAVSDIKKRIASPLRFWHHLVEGLTSERQQNFANSLHPSRDLADPRLMGQGLRWYGMFGINDSVLVRKKSNIQLIADDFQKLVSEFSLAGFVVGYPFAKGQNSLDVSQLQVEYFVNELRETGKLDGLHYTYWDEHYTSKCVESLLHPLALHPVEAKTMSDKFAAVGILQGYLDSMWRNQRPKTIPKK